MGPSNPSLPSSSPRSGVSATAASIRDTITRHRSRRTGRHMCVGKPRMRCHTMRGRPLRRASTAASTARPPSAMRMSTGSPARCRRNARAPSQSRAQPAVGATSQRRQIHVLASVEPESERENPIGVAQRVEPTASSTATSSRAAALAPSDEMQDSHPGHRVTSLLVHSRLRCSTMEPRGAILVLPTVTEGQQGPVAALVSTAGWASGLRRLLGEVWIVTPDGVIDPDDLRRRASDASLAPPRGSRWQRRVPSR